MNSEERREACRRIASEAGRVKPVFSTNAEAALKVRRAVERPDCPIELAARLIVAEPLLASRVVAMANSVAFSGRGREITDVRDAVSRLGFRVVSSLVTVVVIQQMMAAPDDPRYRSLAVQLWEHTAHVAALAHVIARRVTRLDRETALFAGVVHEVGGFYLLARAREFPGLLDAPREELGAAWSVECERAVGRAVLDALGVPAAVRTVVESCWTEELTLPPASLGDTLLLADALAKVPSPLRGEYGSDSPLWPKIEQARNDKALIGALAEAEEEVASLVASLH